MGKIKQEKDTFEDNNITVKEEPEELTYEDKIANTSIIAKPMASKKLAKKCYKLLKKASKHKTFVRNGLKEVQKRIRKGESGILIFAGDISPVDIMIHLPAVCEDKEIPYCYTPSRVDLGAALGVKRGSAMALIREKDDYLDLYKEVREEISYLGVKLD